MLLVTSMPWAARAVSRIGEAILLVVELPAHVELTGVTPSSFEQQGLSVSWFVSDSYLEPTRDGRACSLHPSQRLCLFWITQASALPHPSAPSRTVNLTLPRLPGILPSAQRASSLPGWVKCVWVPLGSRLLLVTQLGVHKDISRKGAWLAQSSARIANPECRPLSATPFGFSHQELSSLPPTHGEVGFYPEEAEENRK